MVHISKILKKGCSLKAEKIKLTKEVKALFAETIRQQEAVIEQQNKPFINLQITI